MSYVKIGVLSALNLVGVYLFAVAPPPLPEAGAARESEGPRIPIATAFQAFDTINSEARRVYTARIVGAGKEAGLNFHEHWRDADREAGPLPALFFRLVASDLTKRPEPLSVFLGSDAPISPSNKFTGEQNARFALIRADGRPQIFQDSDRNQVGMFPDPASAKPCVTCHNEHTASPKKDWRLDDVMGAATWIYPNAEVTQAEFNTLVRNVYAGVEAAWTIYLAKTATFAEPVRVAAGAWPGQGQGKGQDKAQDKGQGQDGRVLPDPQTFMDAVYAASAPKVMKLLNDGLKPPAARPDASRQAKLEAIAK